MSKQEPFSIELEKIYTTGKRTFTYRLFFHHWKYHIVAVIFLVLAWAIYIGPFADTLSTYISSHPTWYINNTIIAFWSILITISVWILAVFGASVDHHHLKFMLDEHAFHIHKGLFFIKETNIPYRQISNIHIDRPYHYHLLGLAQFDIVTTADKDMARVGKPAKDFLIPIIDMALAKELSKQLTRFSSLKNSRHEESFDRPRVDKYEQEIVDSVDDETEDELEPDDQDEDEEDMSTNTEDNEIDTKVESEAIEADVEASHQKSAHKKITTDKDFDEADDFENEIRNYSRRI